MLPSSRSQSVLALVLAAMWAANGLAARAQTPAQSSRQRPAKPPAIPGKQAFASTCASCHGLDGKGSDRAPNIADRANVRRFSDAQMTHIIENGVPGTGMPAFHSLKTADVKAVVTYLRTLQGTRQTLKLPGDPIRGETIFFGKAGCSGCHMVTGKGGFIASDLSAYASTHAAQQIRSAITSPTPSNRQARQVTASVRGGEKVAGRIRNEDNFSVQLQSLDGVFHFLMKSDLQSLEYDSQTLMPSNYSSTLSPDELNDVVSYLMRVANANETNTPTKADEWEE
jgi:cytochrome c oxidase cbb3-type subunit 3